MTLVRAVLAFPVIVCVQLLLTTGVVYFLASVNVTFRDLQHILVNIMMFAFFLTPVMYSAEQIPAGERAGVARAMAALADAELFAQEAHPIDGTRPTVNIGTMVSGGCRVASSMASRSPSVES